MFKLSYRVAQFSALGAIFAICMWRKVLTFCIWQGLWFYIRTTAGILLIFVSSPVQIQSIKSLFFFSVSNAIFNISGSVQAAQGHWMLNSFKFICQVTINDDHFLRDVSWSLVNMEDVMSCIGRRASLSFLSGQSSFPYHHHEALTVLSLLVVTGPHITVWPRDGW